MELRFGRRVFRERPLLNLVPLLSGTDMVSLVDGRAMTVARWYSAAFLTVTVDLTVPCRPRAPGISWSFPDLVLRRILRRP